MRRTSNINPKTFALILIQLTVIVLILVAKYALEHKSVEPDTVLEVCSYSLTLNIVWIAFAWRLLGGSLFSPFILFMGSVSVFNAGQVFLEVFGLNRNGLLAGEFPTELLAETALFVLFSLSVLNLGGIMSADYGRSSAKARPSQIPDRVLRQVAVLLFLIALAPSVMEAKRAVDLVIAGGYMALYRREIATGLGASASVLSGFLVPSAFLFLAGSKDRLLTRIAACGIIGSYVSLQFFLGGRGGAITVLATSLWLWHVVIGAVPKKVLLSAVVAAFLLLPVIGVLRVLPAGQRSSLSAWLSTYEEIDNPAVALLREMGGSMGTTAHTIALVPDMREFEYGASYVYAVSTAIPNLFWSVHPGILHSPSKWLVETVNPEFALAGGGLGYSLIAEGYLNFAFIGAGVPMLLIGWGVGALSWLSEMEASPIVLCFVALAMIPLLMYARSEFGNVVRGIVWYGGIPYILVKWWPKRRRSPLQINEELEENQLVL